LLLFFFKKRHDLTSPDSNENAKCFPCWEAFCIVMDSGKDVY
jgi:hypothetical protein